MVILAVGFRPNTAFAGEGIERFRNGAFLVNKRPETSIPGVYAIGDCATIYEQRYWRHKLHRIGFKRGTYWYSQQLTTSVALTLKVSVYKGSNGISIYGLNLVSTGVTLEKATPLGFSTGSYSRLLITKNQNSSSTW